MPSSESVADSLAERLQHSVIFGPAGGFEARLLPVDRIQERYERVQQSNHGSWFEALLQEMQISFSAGETDLKRIPRSGPVLAVSNHPFGMLDSAVLAARGASSGFPASRAT